MIAGDFRVRRACRPIERTMAAKHHSSRFYLGLALTMSAVCYYSFWLTYFGPSLSGGAPRLSATVHVHGWSFFLWYLLLPLQAGLVSARRVNLHRTLGGASVVLVAVMVVTGLVVVTVQVASGSPLWARIGLVIFSVLVLFLAFYVLALRHWRTPALHKRYIVLASSVALGAAVFRLLLRSPVRIPEPQIVGILLSNLFIVAAMLHDRRDGQRVHPVYIKGFALALTVEVVAVALALSPAGGMINAGLAAVGRALRVLYV
jgi:hypothetical protein